METNIKTGMKNDLANEKNCVGRMDVWINLPQKKKSFGKNVAHGSALNTLLHFVLKVSNKSFTLT